MKEINPLAARLIESPGQLAVFKLMATGLGVGIVFVWAISPWEARSLGSARCSLPKMAEELHIAVKSFRTEFMRGVAAC